MRYLLFAGLLLALRFGASAMPDWLDAELLIVFAMAGAGVYTMVSEGRAHRRDAAERIALHERLASLEQACGAGRAESIGDRVTSVEMKIADDAPHSVAERVAEVEGRLSEWPSPLDMFERLVRVETRIDWVAARATVRKADGKFASPNAAERPTKEAPR